MLFEILFDARKQNKQELLDMLEEYALDYLEIEDGFISAIVSNLGYADPHFSHYNQIDDFSNGLPYNYYCLTPEQAEKYLIMYYPASAFVRGVFHGFIYDCSVFTTMDIENHFYR